MNPVIGVCEIWCSSFQIRPLLGLGGVSIVFYSAKEVMFVFVWLLPSSYKIYSKASLISEKLWIFMKKLLHVKWANIDKCVQFGAGQNKNPDLVDLNFVP